MRRLRAPRSTAPYEHHDEHDDEHDAEQHEQRRKDGGQCQRDAAGVFDSTRDRCSDARRRSVEDRPCEPGNMSRPAADAIAHQVAGNAV